MQALSIVRPDEVESEPLSEHVRPVTRDPMCRRGYRDPLAAEREIDDGRVVEFAHLGPMLAVA
jgi:hypothetical protein